MKIERPFWGRGSEEKPGLGPINAPAFYKWFDKYVEPVNKMLADAIEVYRIESSPAYTLSPTPGDTHKALLINIQPIRKETAEDVLRCMLREREENPNLVFQESWFQRAKAVLEKK